MEQQDNILTQLQQELKAERDRHADTGRHLQKAKKANHDLQDDIENYHKQVGDLATTVSYLYNGGVVVHQCVNFCYIIIILKDKEIKWWAQI